MLHVNLYWRLISIIILWLIIQKALKNILSEDHKEKAM